MISTIYRSPSTYITLQIDQNTEQVQRLMGDDIIRLIQTYQTVMDIALGDYYLFNGSTYYVNQLPSVKKISSNKFDHDVVFEGVQYELMKVQFLSIDSEADFYLTGTLDTFLDLIVTNVIREYAGWSKGTVDATDKNEYKTLNFSGESCWRVLERLVTEYDGEFSAQSRSIDFRDSISTASGLSFSYGENNGLRGIDRISDTTIPIITRLYAYGSEKNIDSGYRSGKRRLEFSSGGNKYVQQNTTNYGVYEHTKIFEYIFPSFTGSAGTLTAPTATGNYTFQDVTIDFNLNNYLLPGITPKVHWQSGDLAGYEFEVSKFNSTTNSISALSYTDEYTGTLPNNTLYASTGDKYKFIDITMPTAYVATAESNLYAAATSYLADYSTPLVKYRIDPDWRVLKDISTSLAVGSEVTITDTDFSLNLSTRVVSLVRKITRPSNYSLDIATFAQEPALMSVARQVALLDLAADVSKVGDILKAQQGWQSSRGQNTKRTYATDSGLPGNDTRIFMDGINNRLDWYKEGVLKLRIDDDIVGTTPGIKLFDGVVYNYKDAVNFSKVLPTFIELIQNTEVYGMYILNRFNDSGHTGAANFKFESTSSYPGGKQRYGIRTESTLTSGTTTDHPVGIYTTAETAGSGDAIGVLSEATTTGSGTAYSGKFDAGNFLVKLLSGEKFTLQNSAGADIFKMTGVGTAYIGNVASSNVLTVEPDGTLKAEGDATVWNDLQFQISAGKQPTSSAPTWGTLTTNTGEYAFDVNEYIDLASNELPHSWEEGTAGNFHLHIAIPNANGTGFSRYAKFTIYIAYVNSSNVWTETSLTAEEDIVDGSGVLENFYLDMGDVSFSGLTIGTQVKVRVKRIAATGGTEYGSDVYIHQVGCHLEEDTMGSRQEISK